MELRPPAGVVLPQDPPRVDVEQDPRPGLVGRRELDADPNRFIGCAVFEDRDSYRANADNSAQDDWFRRLRELLTVTLSPGLVDERGCVRRSSPLWSRA